MKPSIGLLGANGAGKSTIADYLVAEHGYRKLSFAEPLRELARLNDRWRGKERQYGYNGAKAAFPWFRQYLIDLGEGIRKYDPVYFVKALAQKITDMDPDKPWVIDDVRKQVEVNFLGDMGFRFMQIMVDGSNPAGHGLTLPTRALNVVNNRGGLWMTKVRIARQIMVSEWALGTEVKADDTASSPPVLEQRDTDQAGEGRAADDQGGSAPHWCSRCEDEWVRYGNFFPPAVGEARARWHANEGGRGRDEVERHGSVGQVRDGEGDSLRGDPA